MKGRGKPTWWIVKVGAVIMIVVSRFPWDGCSIGPYWSFKEATAMLDRWSNTK